MGLLRYSVLVAILGVASAEARSVYRPYAANITVGATPLVLNGTGVRKTKLNSIETLGLSIAEPLAQVRDRTLSVYEAALYLPAASGQADSIMAASGVRRIELQTLLSLDGAKLGKGLKIGFDGNCKTFRKRNATAVTNVCQTYKPVFEKLKEIVTRADHMLLGDNVSFTFEPGQVVIRKGATELGTLKDSDFPGVVDIDSFIMSFWLGVPPERNVAMKDGMLGVAAPAGAAAAHANP